MAKVAVITGAGRGIGRATAYALAMRGYDLALCDRSGKCAEVVAELTHADYRAMAWKVDVTHWEEFLEFFHDVYQEYGRIDVLVNNAGAVHPRKSAQEIVHADFDPCFETNTIAPMTAMQAVLPSMLEHGYGVIVNVASKAAWYAVPGFAAYNMSKAALVSLTQTMAKELKGSTVRLYTVSPGGTNTEMRASVYGKDDASQKQPPEDVADVIVKLIQGEELNTRYDGLVKANSGDDVLVWGHIEVHRMEDMF